MPTPLATIETTLDDRLTPAADRVIAELELYEVNLTILAPDGTTITAVFRRSTLGCLLAWIPDRQTWEAVTPAGWDGDQA